MDRRRKILIISGPSGTGKSTLISGLLGQRDEFELVKSVTDRNPRYEGEHYEFVSSEQFEKMRYQGQLLESNVYGLRKRLSLRNAFIGS